MAADYKTLLGLVKEFVEFSTTRQEPSAELVERARAAVAPSAPKPVNAPEIIHFLPHDPCCSKHFQKAARTGAVDAVPTWECPSCGTVWQGALVPDGGTSRHWQPECAISVMKL